MKYLEFVVENPKKKQYSGCSVCSKRIGNYHTCGVIMSFRDGPPCIVHWYCFWLYH